MAQDNIPDRTPDSGGEPTGAPGFGGFLKAKAHQAINDLHNWATDRGNQNVYGTQANKTAIDEAAEEVNPKEGFQKAK